VKVISHFNDEGPNIQKLIEELLLECCTIKQRKKELLC